MSKHRVLTCKPQLRLEWRGQDCQNETEQPDHSASLSDSITASTQIRFSVHTTRAARGNSRPQGKFFFEVVANYCWWSIDVSLRASDGQADSGRPHSAPMS